MTRPREGHGLVIGLVGVLALGLTTLALWVAKKEEAPSQVPTHAKPSTIEPVAPLAAAAPPPAAPPATPAPSPSPPKPRLAPELEQQRESSARMRNELRATLGSNAGAAPANDPGEREATEQPTLDKDYIRERMREDLVPVAVECYESVLAEQPDAGGKIVMTFAILGDPEVGGVVDEAAVDPVQSDFDNAFLRECMTESLMAINFEAPPEGGRVEVTYPFVFEPGEDE